MNAADFVNSETGRIVRSMGGHDAFVPAAPPPQGSYSPSVVRALSRADAALSELSGLGRQLPSPHLLIGPYVRREAVLSSRIEGTRSSLNDILLDDIGVKDLPVALEADRLEVRNYVASMEHGLELLQRRPVITLNLVKDLHARLMEDMPAQRGGRIRPGAFRTGQNWIGARDSTIESATYVPPPPELLMNCLDEWERFVNDRESFPDLIQCAIIHEWFESIHPFIDGNGRVGRLLITLFLVERERLMQPLLYLSDYIEARRPDYYELLRRVRTHGDWQAWFMYFLVGVESTARAALQQTTNLLELREDYFRRLRGKANAAALIDHLFDNPYLTAARAVKLLGVSDPTARSAIATLVAEHILEETTGRSWGRVYRCTAILDAISRREIVSSL